MKRWSTGDASLYPPLHFHPGDDPLVAPDVDDGDGSTELAEVWPVIEPGTCWGELGQDFTLRTTFTVPNDWQVPVSLFLPIGNAHQFVHPEALSSGDCIAVMRTVVRLGLTPQIGVDPAKRQNMALDN